MSELRVRIWYATSFSMPVMRAVADLVEELLAAELRVVALLVDRERAVADDRDAAVGGAIMSSPTGSRDPGRSETFGMR